MNERSEGVAPRAVTTPVVGRVAPLTRGALSLAFATALAACAAASTTTSSSDGASGDTSASSSETDQETTMATNDDENAIEHPLADVTAFALTDDGIVVDVVSTGCTTDASVEARVERVEGDVVALTLLRVEPDGCRRMPMNRRLELTRESLGLGEDDRVVLRNPIGRLPGRRGAR